MRPSYETELQWLLQDMARRLVLYRWRLTFGTERGNPIVAGINAQLREVSRCIQVIMEEQVGRLNALD